jgi:hypothetical protein
VEDASRGLFKGLTRWVGCQKDEGRGNQLRVGHVPEGIATATRTITRCGMAGDSHLAITT